MPLPKPPHEAGPLPKTPGPHPPKHKPPHKSRWNALLLSFLAGTTVAIIFAGALLLMGISVNVVIPATAPIWVGTATLAFMAQENKP